MDSRSAAPPRHAPGDEMDHAATSFRNADLLGFEGKVATEVTDQLDTKCFREIQNVLWIENFSPYRKALEEWERKVNLLNFSIERKKSREENVANEIYNLIGFYSVFQCILLTAVSLFAVIGGSGKEPVCLELRLYLFLLSCSVSLLTILGAIDKLGRVREIATSILIEEQDFVVRNRLDVNVKVQELRRCGRSFKFRDRKYHKPSQLGISWPEIVIVPALLVLACLFSLSIWLIIKE